MLSLPEKIKFQAELFQNVVDFQKVCRILGNQEWFRPTHVAKDLVRYESSYGLSVGFNKANCLIEVKSSELKLLFTGTGEVGQHLFKTFIQKKVRCSK